MHVYSSFDILNEAEWQSLCKEAESYDRTVFMDFEQNDAYLEWLNAKPVFVKDAILAMPMDAFYTDTKTQEDVYRIYGVVENKNNTCSYHIAYAGYMVFREHIIDANALLRIDKWTEKQCSKIRLSGWAEIFMHPNGWMKLLSMQHNK